MKKLKVSTHAKTRIAERVQNGSFKNPVKLFQKAIKDGYSPNQFDSEFMYYLKGKTKNWEYNARIYDDNIYIHKNNTLITVLAVPEEFLPIKDHVHTVIKNKEEFRMDLKEIVATRPNIERKKGPAVAKKFKEYDDKLLELGYKECRECKSVKKIEQFVVNKSSKDGHGPYCNSCLRTKRQKMADSKLRNITTDEVEVKPIEKVEKVEIKEEVKQAKSYDIQAIVQATSFKEYLKENEIEEKDFISFLENSANLVKLNNAMHVYNHLASESRELYVSLYKKGE